MTMLSTLAAQGYAATRPATEAKPGATAGKDPSGTFAGIAEDFANTLKAGETTAEKGMTGGADSHSVVTALAESQLAIETAVAVRDKVVEAYQELLRMPV